MAGAATDGIEQVLHRRAYQVVLNEKGNLRWLDNSGDETIVLDKEPDTSWWRRTTAQMGRILPVRGQL
jgi:putative cardiolipin synthase